ncbi:MAG: hypothetical protein H6602_03710 [Flavobacteriales bacterium]|nr:hypothetical protein [Flavobacteriales bacterium]MCB9190747.1 hypothetical protein [Flavobacteriales bacterium]
MNKIVSILVVISVMILVSTVAFAQAPPPNTNPPGAPIDGLVAVLLAAGVGYGVYSSKKEAA